jgi:hypothetical protein
VSHDWRWRYHTSGQLNDMGVVGYFSGLVSSSLAAANMGWMQAFGLLHFGRATSLKAAAHTSWEVSYVKVFGTK